MQNQEIVTFQNVRKSYFLGEVEIKALNDISFSVQKLSYKPYDILRNNPKLDESVVWD